METLFYILTLQLVVNFPECGIHLLIQSESLLIDLTDRFMGDIGLCGGKGESQNGAFGLGIQKRCTGASKMRQHQ